MTDKRKKLVELIKNNPKLSGNKLYEKSKKLGISIRKTDFYSVIRDVRNLPEPSKEKKKKSVPKKFITEIKKDIKEIKVKMPFKKTKFGKLVKNIQDKTKINEKDAIERARALLKIPKRDYRKLRKIDRSILFDYHRGI